MPSSDVSTHVKSKTRFSSGKPRNIVWKCLHDTQQLTELLYSFRSPFMFNVQTINCEQYSEPAVIQTRSQSRNEINTHGILSSKQFPLIEKKLFGP